ncbi:hypothetical protein MPH_08667, partial [Macrophomina phaseolina MS6]
MKGGTLTLSSRQGQQAVVIWRRLLGGRTLLSVIAAEAHLDAKEIAKKATLRVHKLGWGMSVRPRSPGQEILFPANDGNRERKIKTPLRTWKLQDVAKSRDSEVKGGVCRPPASSSRTQPIIRARRN